MGKLNIREIKIWETEFRDVEIRDIEIWEIEFGILIAYPSNINFTNREIVINA